MRLARSCRPWPRCVRCPVRVGGGWAKGRQSLSKAGRLLLQREHAVELMGQSPNSLPTVAWRLILAAPSHHAAHVAAAVANRAYNSGVATELPRPHDLVAQAHSWMYNPKYRRYR